MFTGRGRESSITPEEETAKQTSYSKDGASGGITNMFAPGLNPLTQANTPYVCPPALPQIYYKVIH